MAIEVICPSCDQVHKVKDDAAGKKLRCKGCQEVIPIPAAAAVEEADPWDTGEMEEPAPRQAPRQAPRKSKAKAAKPERARARSSDGMPIPIMMSIGINGLFIALNVLGIVMNAMNGGTVGAGGSLIRLGVDVSIIRGLLNRSNRIRWNAIILDGVGLVFGLLCLGSISFVAADPRFQQQMPAGSVGLLMAIFAVQEVFWIVDLVMLLTPSARDYCNE